MGVERTREVELPSGGTWTLNVKPTWAQCGAIAKEADVTATLALLTTEWSFPGPVTAEAVEGRDMEDVITVLEVYHETVLPLFQRLGSPKSSD